MAATEAVVVEAAALAVELVVPPEVNSFFMRRKSIRTFQGARATETADMSVRAMEAVR